MRFRTALSLATLFLVCFTVAAWSTPLPSQPPLEHLQPRTDNQSLSGKISSIGEPAFSLEVTKNQDVGTVEFLVGGDTIIEGKLELGAHGTVEYRFNSGKNVAVRVVATQASGMGLH
jgi:hypothetical protein